MALRDTEETNKDRVAEHESIKHDEQAMQLFGSLNNSVDLVKELIKTQIPEPQTRSFILTTI